MGVYKFSEAGTFVEPRTLYKSMLAGNEAFVIGDYELIATEILTSPQTSVTFSSLGTYSADYKHLQVRLVVRDAAADTGLDLKIYLNNANSTYSVHRLIGNGSNVQSTGTSGLTNGATIGVTQSANDTDNSFAAGVVDILDAYNTSKNTTVRTFNGVVGGSYARVSLNSAGWYATDSLTSIKFDVAGPNLVAGSRFSLYGIKG
jgi:hypothetical protein